MNVVQRTLRGFRERKRRIVEGGVNCIPSPFPNFRNDYPGVEQGKYYLVSGAAKSAKTQIASSLFVYSPLLYAYEHPEQVRLKIFYFPLEETDEKITARFCSHLLHKLSNYKIRVSPMVLNSTNENNTAPNEVLDLLDTIEYQSILNFYLEHVEFVNQRNPTGCWKRVLQYAQEHGKIVTKEAIIGGEKKKLFDYYEPNDPNEYVIILWDHAGLTELERGWNLKQCIDKLSEYFIDFRDKFHYTPVLIQQQNIDTISLDAFKQKKIMPTLAGLADTKNTGKDASVMLGITNPHAFEIDEYRGYNTKRLGGYGRFLEIVLNREGESNGYLPLYFDGAVNFFRPLPKPNNLTELSQVYNLIDRNMLGQS